MMTDSPRTDFVQPLGAKKRELLDNEIGVSAARISAAWDSLIIRSATAGVITDGARIPQVIRKIA